jgi:prokaryotic ubiquitin-like protein Pup
MNLRKECRTVPEKEQKRIQRKGGADDASDDAGQVQSSSKAEELKDEMDEILDEIDAVLEENAEEFVKSYVQKGGE